MSAAGKSAELCTQPGSCKWHPEAVCACPLPARKSCDIETWNGDVLQQSCGIFEGAYELRISVQLVRIRLMPQRCTGTI